MVLSVGSPNHIPYLPKGKSSLPHNLNPGTENNLTGLVIPLILYNHDQVAQKQSRKLYFVDPSQLSEIDLAARCLAKLIIQGNEHHIKIEDKISSLDFDEFVFEYTREGAKFQEIFNKDKISIEILEGVELAEIQQIVNDSLSQKKDTDTNSDSPIEDSRKATSDPNRPFTILPYINLTISLNAIASAQRQRKEERSLQRRLDEQAMTYRDIKERARKHREKKWLDKQRYFELKDEIRSLIKEGYLSFEIKKQHA